MRAMMFIIHMLWFASAFAQKGPVVTIPYDTLSQQFAYTGVVEIENLEPSEMYSNAKAWLFENNGDTVLVDAVTDSKLVDRGVIPVNFVQGSGMAKFPMTYFVMYTIVLEFKQGRYRYTVSKFNIGGDGTATAPGMSLESYVTQHESMKLGRKTIVDQVEQVCTELDAEVKKLIESMKAGVKAPKKIDDW